MENNLARSSSRPLGPSATVYEYLGPLGSVREFVTTHLHEDLSLSEVAKVANLSPKYFSAYFRRLTGRCYTDWLSEIRIMRARALLAEKNYPVSRVALLVGFSDVRTFQRTFKKLTGSTPRAYKKSVAP